MKTCCTKADTHLEVIVFNRTVKVLCLNFSMWRKLWRDNKETVVWHLILKGAHFSRFYNSVFTNDTVANHSWSFYFMLMLSHFEKHLCNMQSSSSPRKTVTVLLHLHEQLTCGCCLFFVKETINHIHSMDPVGWVCKAFRVKQCLLFSLDSCRTQTEFSQRRWTCRAGGGLGSTLVCDYEEQLQTILPSEVVKYTQRSEVEDQSMTNNPEKNKLKYMNFDSMSVFVLAVHYTLSRLCRLFGISSAV